MRIRDATPFIRVSPAPETPSGPVVENLAARVYVHNLPWALTNEGLALHMSRCGVVRFASIMTAADGRSKVRSC